MAPHHQYQHHLKPENAIKRANELLNVQKDQEALDVLHQVILTTNKKRNFQLEFEPLIIKLLELCVNLQKSKIAKESLHAYKQICQSSNNIQSLDKVIDQFLTLAEERCSTVDKELQTAEMVEDLDRDDEDVESLLMTLISGEDTKARRDRIMLTPLLKFLWEGYRTGLEMLRNNARVEYIYSKIVSKAVGFCQKYKRLTEFRHLCELLRNHLRNLQAYKQQANAVDLSKPEVMQQYISTRFELLNAATDLELWQEAFRIVQDIRGLIQIAIKPPRPAQMAIYFQKLGDIFHIGKNYLYHAFALYKQLCIRKKHNLFENVSERNLADSLLIAAVCIPAESPLSSQAYFSFHEASENRMLGSLVGVTQTPSRKTLLHELEAKGVLSIASPEVREFYCYFEKDFRPLNSAKETALIYEFMEKADNLKQYLQPLQKAMLLKVIVQLSSVYTVFKLEQLYPLAAPLTRYDVERILVEAARHRILSVKIDHQKGTLHFATNNLEASAMRLQLQALGRSLGKVAHLLDPQEAARFTERKTKALERISASMIEENKKLLARRAIIERRKEMAEHILLEKQKQEEDLLRRQLAEREAAERKRLIAESERREQERLRKEKAETEALQKQMLMEQVEQMNKGKKKAIKIEDIEGLDQSTLMAKQREQLEAQQEELHRRMANTLRRIDYLTRAFREAEQPLLVEQHRKLNMEARRLHDERKKQRMAEFDSLNAVVSQVAPDLLAYQSSLNKDAVADYEARRAEYEARRAEIEDERRREAAAHQAELERQRRLQREREEAERRRREEEEEMLREEERRRREEEAAQREREEQRRLKREQEEAERKAELERVEEKKRLKEREIEERMQRDRARPAAAAAAAGSSGGSRGGKNRFGGRGCDCCILNFPTLLLLFLFLFFFLLFLFFLFLCSFVSLPLPFPRSMP
eukprot:GCRY01000806.1.p1 GENE.GCRY01000806.1~~GCRY01000806.1.p1  ORF type:complete len:930 (-),score=328.37 GCRY01000806.1:230-3019(-)